MNLDILADLTPRIKKTSDNASAASSLQYFKGVGPAKAQLLVKLGIRTAADLLSTFPRGWEDRRLRFSIREAPMHEKIALKGRIGPAQFSTTRSRLAVASVWLEDGS